MGAGAVQSSAALTRLHESRETGRERGVLPINIALAYVLCYPFPTFPIIGPRTLEETRNKTLISSSSMGTLHHQLGEFCLTALI